MDGMYNQLQLIEEVKKRPILYSLEKHHDKDEKFALWKEVGAALFSEWNTLNKAEVYDRVLQIQRKWRSLRDAYNRELRGRRSGVRVNKCVYRYFKPLSFLGGFDGNISDTNDQEENSIQSTPENTAVTVEYIDPLVNIKKKRQKKKMKRKLPSEDEDDSPRPELEMPLYTMDISENETDSDRLFLLSFVQEMKQLPVNVKMWARAQIANIMQEAVASQYSSSSMNTLSEHRESKITAMPVKMQRLDDGSECSDEFKEH